MRSGDSRQFGSRSRTFHALLMAAVVGTAGGCMRDTINGGVSAAGAGAGGAPMRGTVAGATPGAGGAGASGSAAGAGGSNAGAAAGGASGGAGAGGAIAGRGHDAGASAGAGAGAGAAGAAAGSGGAAGASGSTAPELVQPIERAGKYVFEFGDLLFEIDPLIGGRIVKCQIDGQNLLTGPDVDPINYGSTFWPSPQQRWNWPPVPELDSQPYTAAVSGETVALKSAVGERAKVEVTKRFTARPSERTLEVEYELTNRDTVAASWAPWEITRVAANGLSFFPTGTATVNSQLPVVTMGGVTWYQHDPSKVGMGQKFSADGKEGWLAHVAGDTLLLKTFVDVALEMQAPAPEAEIALYAAAGYVELEPQGPYAELMPGQSVRWTVRWTARKLADGVQATVGDAALVDFARSLAETTR